MNQSWDVVVIGTGFGGSLAALRLARAGYRVLVLERGRRVDRDETAWDPRSIHFDRKYRDPSPYEVSRGRRRTLYHPNSTVGGQSVFYGAASFRLRAEDFEPRDDRAGSPWPIRYADLEPFYDEAETLLGVAGVAGADPTEPPRRGGYAAPPPPYGTPARRVADAARSLGLRPFPIPLAINFHAHDGRAACVQCMTCDMFPCRIGAKNDLSVTVLPEAARHGALVREQTVARRLEIERGRVRGVGCVDLATGEEFTAACGLCVVACGAIGSAALLLASGLGEVSPNGRLIGRYLMRHCSGIVIGVFPFETNPERRFHKQIAITDFYFGHPDGKPPAGRWGMLQGLQVPPPEMIAAEAPRGLKSIAAGSVRRHIYLLCLAEDVPNLANRVEIDPRKTDARGVPVPQVHSTYDRRDLAGRAALYREAHRILRRAGAWVRVRMPIDTYSHALGTCRFGDDPHAAVLDRWGRFHGVRNLFVSDGSFMPTSGGVNPSLTIAAAGLRSAGHIVEHWTSLAG